MGSLGKRADGLCSHSRGSRVVCTSLKANMGHLEACAAAAGLASLLATPLLAGLVPTNAQLRRFGMTTLGLQRGESTPCRLNAHVVSLLRSYQGAAAFQMPVGGVGRVSSGCFVESCEAPSAPLSGRLSSFGFSGTIAHGLFCCSHR